MADESGRTFKKKDTEAKPADRWLPVVGRLVVAAGFIVSVGDVIVLRHGTNAVTLGVGIVGFALLFLGFGLYLSGRLTLGKLYSETVRIRPDHRLVTRGLYHSIRHPIYLGEILYAFSIPIILGSLYGFLVMLLLIPMIVRRIRIEEKAMASKFGEDYANYARKTKKLIPYLY